MENIPGAGTPGEGLLKFFTAGLRGQAAGLCAKDMEGGGVEGPLGAQEDMGAYWSWE